MPSTTRKIRRSGSACQASSLFRRTRPGSLPPAYLTFVSTMRSTAKFKKHYARQANAGLVGDGSFDVAVALFAVDHFDAGWRRLAVDCGPKAAEVLQEKFAG